MDQAYVMAVLRRVAEENGVTLDTVLKEIDELIRIGTESKDPQIRRRWEAIPSEGPIPTVVELVDYLVRQIR